jgi:hypothetical protein
MSEITTPDHRWKLIEQAVFTEPPAGADGHLRIYCDAACVAIIPVADSSQEAIDRAMQLGHYIADAMNEGLEAKPGIVFGSKSRSDEPVVTWKELQLIREGNRIDAVKAIRSRLGCELREAVDLSRAAEKIASTLVGGKS